MDAKSVRNMYSIIAATNKHTAKLHHVGSLYIYIYTLHVIKTSQLMLYREIIVVCSQIHTKHINTVCGQNVELLNVKLVVHIVTTGLQRIKSLL